MKKILLALIGLVILTTPLISYGVGNYYGVCWPERRILSDSELIDGLISGRYLKFEFVGDERLARDAGIAYSDFSHRLAYSSVAEFLDDNPECCQVEAPGRGKDRRGADKNWSFNDPSFWLRVRGIAHANIGTPYNTPIMTKGGKKIDERGYSSYWVDACGQVVEPPEEYGVI